MQDTMYWPKGTSIKEATRPPVNLGSAKDSQATSIDVNMRLGCDHTDHVNVLPKDHHFNAVLWNEANAHISSEGIEISGEVKIEGYTF